MPGRSNNSANPHDDQKFTGHFLEQEGNLGIYHAQARIACPTTGGYDPAIGRFLGVDAMRSEMPGWNTYHYTFNNPVKYVDPDGNMPSEIDNPLNQMVDRAKSAALSAVTDIAKTAITNFASAAINDFREFVGSAEIEPVFEFEGRVSGGTTKALHGKGAGVNIEGPTATMASFDYSMQEGLNANYVGRNGDLTVSQGLEAGVYGVNAGAFREFTRTRGEGIVENSTNATFSIGYPALSYGHNFNYTQNVNNGTTASLSTGIMGGGAIGFGWKLSGSYNLGARIVFPTNQ